MALSSAQNEFGRVLERVRSARRVCLVGAGGKTALMYALADRLAREGKKVVAATTTRIARPADRPVVGSLKELEGVSAWPVVYAEPAPEGKLMLPKDFDADRLDDLADCAIFEADGAKRMPCKVPREGEPVLVPGADLVLGVAGLSCLGKPLREVCFRLREATRLLGADADRVLGEEDLAAILSSPLGARKDVACPYAVVLNQCDVEDGWNRAARVKEILASETVYAISLLSERSDHVH